MGRFGGVTQLVQLCNMALSDSLQAYWKFDEGSGNAADSTANANTLTNVNTATYEAGLINNGTRVASASSQYFTATDSASLSTTGDTSWSFWIKPGPTSIGSTTDPVVFHKATASNYSYYIQITTTSLTLAASSNGTSFGSATVTLDTMVLTGTQYHIVVVYTASLGRIEVFQNGVSKGTATGTLPTSIFNGTAPLEVGRYGLGTSNYYNGMYDETGIWSRTLSSTEVSQLYNSGSGLAYPFTIASTTDFFALM